MDTESARIADQLRRACEGDAWHGPSVRALLAGLGADQAARHPIPGVHSIWEIVRHMSVWEEMVRRRLGGETIDPTPEENWPEIDQTDEEAWGADRERADQVRAGLASAIEALPVSRLGDPVPGKPYSVYVMLHGVIQHDLYHAGQIALLRKLTT